MNYKAIQPPRQLSGYVRYFWFLEANASIQEPFVHHAFAYSCPEIIICYKGQFKFNIELQPETNLVSGIFGQTQTFSRVTSKVDFGVFGLYLYPHALPQLFRLPASEITDQSLDIKSLCGKEGEILEERIMLALNNDQRVKLVCDFLEARLKNEKAEYTKLFSSINLISGSCKAISVKALAHESFLSMRQFERRCKELSGFSPKLFLRIKRFNSVLKRAFQDSSLTQIAIECGYYDQSHFIHDFQKFSGCNPKDYFNPETMPATDRGTVEFKK
jgi:AraC-like DNA-binding protein